MATDDPAEAARNAVQAQLLPATLQNQRTGQIIETLSNYRTRIAQSIPKGATDLTPERIFEIIATLISRDEKLQMCTTQSVIGAALQCATLGLTPIPQLAEAWFLPYKRKVEDGQKEKKEIFECQFQIGYRGWIALYYRSGLIKNIEAEPVFANDEFDFQHGTKKYIHHARGLNVDRGDLVAVYAIARFITGGLTFVVLDINEIDFYRWQNPQYKYAKKDDFVGAWAQDPIRMALTKPLRRLKSVIPSSPVLDLADAVDGRRILLDDFSANGDGPNAATLLVPDDGMEITDSDVISSQPPELISDVTKPKEEAQQTEVSTKGSLKTSRKQKTVDYGI